MYVALVRPAGLNIAPGQSDLTVLAYRVVPIAVLQLASWVEQHDHPTEVIDCMGPFAPKSIEAQAEAVLRADLELLDCSATTSALMDAVEIATLVKSQRPQVRVVVGNVLASSLGAPLLATFPEIDHLCMGKGEGSMLDPAESEPLTEVDNLARRESEGLRANPRST